MSMIIAPIRRALPLHEWPQGDQSGWAAALTPGDIFNTGGRAAHWAVRTRETNI